MPRLRLAFFFFRNISAIFWLASISATSKEEPIPLNNPNPLPTQSSERFCDMVCTAFSFDYRIIACLWLKSSSKAFRPNW